MGPYYDHQVGRFERPEPGKTARSCSHAHGKRAPKRWPRCSARSGRGLKTAAKAVAGFVRHPARRRAEPPHGDVRHPAPARLTGGCD